MRKPITMAAGMMALMAAPALAQSGFTSAYTDFNLDECLVLEADDFGAEWACPGYKGYPMLVREGDLRLSVTFGFNPDANAVGFQTLPPFNHIQGKVEWRLSNAAGRWMPVATIMRYFTDGVEEEDDEGQILVVTQIAEGNSCHIAYVDARANNNANELARGAADAAGDFDCATGAVEIIGAFGAY